MRKGRFIMMTLFSAALLAGSCQRRDFANKTTGVSLELAVKADVEHTDGVPKPELMRVDLYDPEIGDLAYTDYISSTGGKIHPAPGYYDMIVYNINTESTQIRNESNFNDVEAFTSDVSAYLKSQLKQFLASRAQARAERERVKAEQNGGSSLAEGETAAPSIPEERIVNQPDHLFVGRAENVHIPVMYEDEPDREVVIEVEANSVVETWKIVVSNIEGLQWIRSAVAIMSGQVESSFIGKNEDSDDVVSIYFEMMIDRENEMLVGYLNTFGKHPDEVSELSLDINLVDTSGEEHHYHFDVTSDFFDNPEYHIDVDYPIEIEEPKVEGGGFVPSVEDWESVNKDIIL